MNTASTKGEHGPPVTRRFRAPTVSVRVRILASILLVTLLGMAVAGGAAHLVQRELVLNEVDERLTSSVEAVRAVLTGAPVGQSDGEPAPPGNTPPSFATAQEALQLAIARVIPQRNQSTVGIIDGRARLVPGTAIPFHLEDDPAFIDRVVAEVEGTEAVMGTALSDLGRLRYIAAPIVVDGSEEFGIFLTAYDLDAELKESVTALATYAMMSIAALVVIAGVGWLVAGRLLRPIRQLRLAASRITATDLHERIPVRGNDDVSALTATINEMLERLDSSRAMQSRLLADVRHELSTPITIVRGHLELLDPSDVEDVAATRSLAIEELDRMTGLVRDIEALAAAQGGAPLTILPVDVAEFTEQVFAKAAALPEHEWQLAGTASVVARLDPARITQAWLQLADNAAKYSPPGSLVELGSSLAGAEVELWVRDRGPGIPEEAQHRIFERLGRVDTGRGESGSGLGLAIVTAIAEAHGGRVGLETSASGSRFAIVLPLQEEEP